MEPLSCSIISNYAPVCITTLNRINYLKQCIDSLKRCTLADMTELYISVDYPPSEEYLDGYKEVLRYLRKGISGFSKVTIHYQDNNLGALRNINDLVLKVLEEHDTCILLEEDTVVSKCYLEFCNKGLNEFKDDKSVVAINPCDYVWCGQGFNPHVREYDDNGCNVEKRQMVWHSFATWADVYLQLNRFCLSQEILAIGDSSELMDRLKKQSKSLFFSYLSNVYITKNNCPWNRGTIYPIDAIWDICMIVFDRYLVSPVEPMIRDCGVYGGSEHFDRPFKNASYLSNRDIVEDDHFDFKQLDEIKVNRIELDLHDKYCIPTNIKQIIITIIYHVKRFIRNHITHESIRSINSIWD